MALHSTHQSTCQSKYGWPASITQIGALGSTIIDGLGMFGLASNGMCPSLSAETAPLLREAKPSAGSGARR